VAADWHERLRTSTDAQINNWTGEQAEFALALNMLATWSGLLAVDRDRVSDKHATSHKSDTRLLGMHHCTHVLTAVYRKSEH